MSRFDEEGSRLFKQLDEKHDRTIVEHSSEIVDNLVVRIQELKDFKDNVTDKQEKAKLLREEEKLLDELLRNIHLLLKEEVGKFYARYKTILLRRGVEVEDVYNEAVKFMIGFVEKWQTKDVRRAAGKEGASFLTFFLHKQKGVTSRLFQILIDPAFARKRFGYEISMDHPVMGQDGELVDFKPIIDDSAHTENLADRLDIAKLSGESLLDKVYLGDRPFVSLFLILHYGFGKDVLQMWARRLDKSIEGDNLDAPSRRYISKVGEVVSSYEGQPMTLEEIGEKFGMVRENVRLKVVQALSMLTDKLK